MKGLTVAELGSAADRLLWQGIRQANGQVALVLLTTVVSAGATVAFPAVFAATIDAQFSGTGSGHPLIWLIAVLTVLVLCEVLGMLAATSSTATVTRWLRLRLLRHVLALGLPGRDRFAPGDLVSRLVTGTSEAGGSGPALANSASSIVVSLGAIVALALIDPLLALTFLVGAPLGLFVVKMFLARTSHLTTDYLAVYGTVAGRLVEALAGIRTIRASGTVDREVDRVLAPTAEFDRLGRETWRAYARVSWQAALLAPGMQLAVLSVAGFEVVSGRITAGQFLASIGYTSLGLGFLGQAGLLMALARARGGARRLAEILGRQPIGSGAGDLPDGPGELVLRGITVTTGGRVVLDRVDLTVPAATSLALVGGSASGKSTLAAVAGRLIVPDEGEVLLDDVPIDTVAPAVLRREITFAFEEPALLGATVRDAIAFGADVGGPIEHAACIAGADQFVRRLPLGYDTALETVRLSGGEVQRLGLARSVAHCGRLLILDDATSGLDIVTETQVRAVLTEAMAGRTRLVIAHRVATAARCDLVAWLDGGRIRAVAPHHVLWRDPGYRHMFQPAGDAT
jgi:ATP-binding cassette subfamily B protein